MPLKLDVLVDGKHPYDSNVNGTVFWRVDVQSITDEPISETIPVSILNVGGGYSDQLEIHVLVSAGLAESCARVTPPVDQRSKKPEPA